MTVRAVEAFRPKADPYKITLDRGLQLRIAPDGKRTLLVRYTVKGSNTERQYRLPQEYGDAPGQLKLSAACAEAGRIRTLARQGVDWIVAEDTRLEAEASTRVAVLQRHAGPTFEAELRDYVEKKRRAKDGLALKARTKSDYLSTIEPSRVTKGGTRRAAGPLHPIAHKPLSTLTASDIRATYEAAARRSFGEPSTRCRSCARSFAGTAWSSPATRWAVRWLRLSEHRTGCDKWSPAGLTSMLGFTAHAACLIAGSVAK
jgi:hypothetical protein